MKKLYVLIFALAAYSGLLAQPILNYSDVGPEAGDNFTVYTFDATSTPTGSVGAGMTWDYSTLTGTSSSWSYVSKSATPYASDFTLATLAVDQGSGAYNYFTSNTSVLAMAGTHNGSYAMEYTDIEEMMRYPMTYGTSFVDNLVGYGNPGVAIDRSGTVTVTADGYGTLILPGGTVTNVLRVKVVEDYSDAMMTSTFDYDATIYQWWVAGLHNPILSITNGVYAGTAINPGYFMDPSSVGIESPLLPEQSVNVFPNPAKDQLNVSYTVEEASEISLSITNMLGQQVRYMEMGTVSQGANTTTLDISDLESGIYMVTIQTGQETVTRKITVH